MSTDVRRHRPVQLSGRLLRRALKERRQLLLLEQRPLVLAPPVLLDGVDRAALPLVAALLEADDRRRPADLGGPAAVAIRRPARALQPPAQPLDLLLEQRDLLDPPKVTIRWFILKNFHSQLCVESLRQQSQLCFSG